MVFLALTRTGLDELSERLGYPPSPLWVNNDVFSKEELADLRAKGVDVTNFSHRIRPDDTAAIEAALVTIAEHHVGEAIWVERNSAV